MRRRCCCCLCGPKLLIIPVAIGIFLVIAGTLIGLLLFPYLLEKLIKESVELREDTVQWDRYVDVPLPFDFKVTFFTIENPEDTLGGAKPVVKEQGPYVYTERRKKVDAKIEDAEVRYNDLISFKFNAEKSHPLTEDDLVHVINIPLIAIMQSIEDINLNLPGPIDQVLREMFEDNKIFTSLRVADYGFGGIQMCNKDKTSLFSSKLICLAAMVMNLRTLKYNPDRSMTFTLFQYKSKLDGPFTANTGTEDIDLLGLLTSYKEKKYLDIWKGGESTCNAVTGHVTTFPPFIKPEGEILSYSTDICKAARIFFKEKSKFKDVDTYKFQMTRDSFATEEQKVDCLCIDRTKGLDGKTHCYNDGVMDLFNCLGAPILISFPHLMWTKEEYQESVIGLRTKEAESNSDSFTTSVEFQPHTGFPVKLSLNIQMNMVLRPMIYNSKVIESTKNLRPAVFPMIVVQEETELTDELLQELRDQLLTNLLLMDVAMWTLIGLGLLAIVISTACLVFIIVRRKNPKCRSSA